MLSITSDPGSMFCWLPQSGGVVLVVSSRSWRLTVAACCCPGLTPGSGENVCSTDYTEALKATRSAKNPQPLHSFLYFFTCLVSCVGGLAQVCRDLLEAPATRLRYVVVDEEAGEAAGPAVAAEHPGQAESVDRV